MAAHLIPKILHTIFHQIREQQGPKGLFSSLQVCKHWKDIANQVLYTNLVLRNDDLAPFNDSCIENAELLSATRSLTLHIQATLHPKQIEDRALLESYRKNGFPQTKALETQLLRLGEHVLPRISGLTKFSLFVSVPKVVERHDLDFIGFRIDNKILRVLLQALPQSCVNLEVDTDMSDWSPDDKPPHICADLCGLLPRLRHVKLRMHTLCSRILCVNPMDPHDRLDQPDFSRSEDWEAYHVVKSDQLRTLSICTDTRERAGPTFVDCSWLQLNFNQGDQIHEPWPNGSAEGNCRPQSLAANIAAAYQANHFPNVKTLEISHKWFRTPEREMEARCFERAQVYQNVVLLRDCIRNVTIPQPMRRISGESPMLAFYDKTDKCVIGIEKDLLRYAENTIWRETNYGARMPDSADSTPSDVLFKPLPRFMSREEWCEQSEYVMVGWKKEEIYRQKIRRIYPLPGADARFSIDEMPFLEGTHMPGRVILGSHVG